MGLFVAPQLVAGGVIAGVVGAVGSLFFDDFEERKKKARLDLQKRLYSNIDKSISQLRRQLNGIVAERIIDQQLHPTSRKISDVVSSLFDLSATQRRLAKRINAQQGKLSLAVILEALAYLGYDGADGSITRAARIPVESSLLVLADGTRLAYSLKRDLAGLLDEGVRYVFECGDLRVMLSRTIGRSCERKNIRIEEVKGEQLIAHIRTLDELGNEARTGIRLGIQITEQLITR